MNNKRLACVSLPADAYTLSRYCGAKELESFYRAFGLDGLELILCGELDTAKIRRRMARGLHAVFYPGWIDLWRGDYARLKMEFGERACWERFFGVKDRDGLIARFRHDFDAAEALGVEYVVFHVSDAALEEYFTMRFSRAEDEIVFETCELVNAITQGRAYGFELLFENVWGGGLTLTRPRAARALIEGVKFEKKGFMFDTGHMMITNPVLKTEREAANYIENVFEAHGELKPLFRGMHLHRSLTGAYAMRIAASPPRMEREYFARYAQAYAHLSRIDPHLPFETGAARRIAERIKPAYLTHELTWHGEDAYRAALSTQCRALEEEG